MPSPGLIRGLRPAAGPGIRDDGGVSAGYEVPMFYDSLIAKLVAWAPSRGEAIHRMSRALAEYHVLGIRTTIPFFLWLMRQPDYVAAEYDTTYLDRLLAARAAAPDAARFNDLAECDEDLVAVAAAVDAWLRSSSREDGAAPGAAARWTSVARREALRG